MFLYADKWGTVPGQIVWRQFWLNHVAVAVECALRLGGELSKLSVILAQISTLYVMIVDTQHKKYGIYIMITKNIRHLLWNRGLWRSLNNTYPIFLTRVFGAPIIFVLPVT